MGSTQPYAATRAVVETSLGTFRLRFFPEVAPAHVENFVKLAESGFYDGTTFHRVIKGFMIQGGDPKGDGTGGHSWKGPGTRLEAEFNDRPHQPGTLSMARTNDPDSAGSQFFICVGRHPFLDGQYTVFGECEAGYEVVERISQVPTDSRDRPREPVTIRKVTIVSAET
ncbi:MAG: peptidylprolyl isomerase [Planctomycetota bacterium]|nr:MAG: peptidylprolyl isomerase [Planctomycetota bacterium]